ncbi:MAG: hypothetical protein RIR79_2146 [Pseudomonadota bacterium]
MPIEQHAEEIKAELRKQNSIKVKVALFGQPGAGKSSLINAILGKDLAKVGVETDITTSAEEYQHNGLVFVDLPGYGTEKFPKDTYFDKFDILGYDLLLCVTSGKLHQSDTEFFKRITSDKKICIFVVNKCESIKQKGVEQNVLFLEKEKDIKNNIQKNDIDVVFTDCYENIGIDELNTLIFKNLEPVKKERWARGAKAYSEEFLLKKRNACEKYVTTAALLAAANGINPIPGADVAVDVGIIVKLFSEIRQSYGLSDEELSTLKHSAIPIVGRLANNIVQYAAQEGVFLLLKSMVGRVAVKSFAKYIPFIGQAVAATVGYKITSSVGNSYLSDCHDLAMKILERKLKS